MANVKRQVDIYGNININKEVLCMKVHVILILIGYISTIIGRCFDTRGSKIAFTGIGVGFLVSAIIVWIISL